MKREERFGSEQRVVRGLWWLALVLATMSSSAFAVVDARIIKDIWSVTADAYPEDLTVLGDTLFFCAKDGLHGRELWKTDGAESGTVMVTDLIPGTGDATIQYLTPAGGLLFFTAALPETGSELWRTDCTAAGTMLLKDIWPGTQGSRIDCPLEFTGRLFFAADDGTHALALWTSDGTPEGTTMIQASSGRHRLNALTVFQDHVYYVATDGMHGWALWKSDGTEAGTVVVKGDFRGDSGGQPQGLTVVGDALFFVGSDTVNVAGIWKSDGTEAGTVLVKDFGGYPVNLINYKGMLVFYQPGQLWKSDGTGAGTVKIADIPADLSTGGPDAVAVGDFVYFEAGYAATGLELWKTDGTPGGTGLVKDLVPGGSSFPQNIIDVGGVAYFYAGGALWRSDGTPDGTVQVFSSLDVTAFGALTAFRGGICFRATDAATGVELWKCDGTSSGTVRIKDINATTIGSYPKEFVKVGESVLFQAATRESGIELWRTDGTAAGTWQVADICPGSGNGEPKHLTLFGNRAYFSAYNPGSGTELWSCNGTPEGLALVKDLKQGEASFDPMNLTAANGSLFFTSWGYELWKTDGTAAGTVLVKDLSPPKNGDDGVPEPKLPSPVLSYLTPVNNTLFFQCGSYEIGYNALWKSDGSAAGTVEVKRIHPEAGSNIRPYLFTACGSSLYFFAYNGIGGSELWRSDGTSAGTKPVLDGVYQSIQAPRTLNGVLYFIASDLSAATAQLWRSDGTAAGTYLVKAVAVPGRDPGGLTVSGGLLYFVADDGVHGSELWKSDGTEAGTVLVKDLVEGAAGSDPHGLLAVNGRVVFTANGGAGDRLWRSDGAAAGTFPCGDGTSYPDFGSAVLDDAVVFAGFDNAHGMEPWRVQDAELRFAVQPQGGWFEAGRGLALTVRATGAAEPVTYQWLKDGVEILGATDASYRISELSLEDAGWYSCRVTDGSAETVTSRPAPVQIFLEGALPATGLAAIILLSALGAVGGVFSVGRCGA